MSGFAELVAATNYSFLRGASHPSDIVGQAMALGLDGIGIADRNTVAGVVRAWVALREAPDKARAALLTVKRLDDPTAELTAEEHDGCARVPRLVVGARLVFVDGTPDIVAYPATRFGWGRLTRLLTLGNLRAKKGGCILRLADLIAHSRDLLLIVLQASSADPEEVVALDRTSSSAQMARPAGGDIEVANDADEVSSRTAPARANRHLLAALSAVAPGRIWLAAVASHDGRDRRMLAKAARLADAANVPLIATNDVLYAVPEQRRLHDVLTCIREGCTIRDAGRRLEANAERYVKHADEMARLFRDRPDAVAESLRLLDRIDFTLDDLAYEYPHEPVPEGWDADGWLAHLAWEAAHARHGPDLPAKLVATVKEELELIRERKYAYYFLTVHDLVRFARAQDPPILCQGRGSAANSAVCFLLGVTSVDPMKYDLLFSRFVSEERNEPPDIDVDFEHERREEVMQYVYRRYGRHRAGIAATVIHYRPRSGVREVGKALGLSEDLTMSLGRTTMGYSRNVDDRRFVEAGVDLANPEIARLRDLAGQIMEFPRHLSQHVGGFVLTQDRLDETVPIHNGAMADRTFIEWDKDDIDALKLMKVDVLSLGMLTCIQKSFELMRHHGLGDHTLEVDLDADDPAVYKMLCNGDSIGVFQVESRAQINMLPRLKPETLYDLTVQVAIVRPGPIEGDMVHPYLRRRSGIDPVEYPSPCPPHDPQELRNLLGQTFGVPLFQEQAMKLAIVAAEFTPSEANQLRRAMATFRHVGGMDHFKEKLIGGMVRRGYEQAFAERCYRQIEGFGSYGFPESHALSFARLVYVSSWIKCHHPAVFTCALLNSQPMGFYAPAQLVADARAHDVEVRAIDINASDWDNSLERRDDGSHALRLGLRQISGFREGWAARLEAARADARFTAVEDLARRAILPSRAIRLLADADACRSIGLDRREALWDARRTPDDALPLFAAADARELGDEAPANLPAMPLSEHVAADYQMTRLSLKDHPMTFIRPVFAAEGVLSCADTNDAPRGATVRTAGVVLIRQRPGKGNAVFITLEDETGIVNVLLWARLFERYRRAVMASRLMLIEGEVQRSPERVVHLMGTRVIDRTAELDRLSDDHSPRAELARGDIVAYPQVSRGSHGHPRDVRILPKSRDFH